MLALYLQKPHLVIFIALCFQDYETSIMLFFIHSNRFPFLIGLNLPVVFFLLTLKFGQYTSFVYKFFFIRRMTYCKRKLKKQKIFGGDFMWF